jgi:serine/threonine protein kinase
VRRRKDPLSASPELPGYVDVAEIGSGTFAGIYCATERATGRSVALKVLRVAAPTPGLCEAFDREARALGAVSAHPNIVSLFSTTTTLDGRLVLVLELCRESLAARVRREGPLPAQEAVSAGIRIAGALQAAHGAGLLHLDVKPHNLLVTEYGDVALADFGVAAFHGSARDAGDVGGFTPVHAAPELLDGGLLSAATDVYGLASTLYQLVAGQAPFTALAGEAPAALVLRILRDPVPPVRGAGLPPALSDVLLAALAKDAADRPPTAAAFAASLQAVEASCGWPQTPWTALGAAIGSGEPEDAPAWGGAAPIPEAAWGGATPGRTFEDTMVVGGLAAPDPTGALAAAEGSSPAAGRRRWLVAGAVTAALAGFVLVLLLVGIR